MLFPVLSAYSQIMTLPLMILATRVPLRALGRLDLSSQAFLYVRQRIVVGCKNLAQERDVSDGQAQSVNLGQAFLVGKRWYMNPQLVEGRVDAAETRTTHPAPPHVTAKLQQPRLVQKMCC